jgi:hypothetical protein
VVDDLGAELVPHHDVAGEIHGERAARAPGGLDEAIGVAEGVQIGAADAAGEGLDQHLAAPRLGARDVRDHELAIPHHSGTHDPPILLRLVSTVESCGMLGAEEDPWLVVGSRSR